jgi:hypothetical protein
MFSKVTYLPIFVAFYQAEPSRGSVISVSIQKKAVTEFPNMPGSLPSHPIVMVKFDLKC